MSEDVRMVTEQPPPFADLRGGIEEARARGPDAFMVSVPIVRLHALLAAFDSELARREYDATVVGIHSDRVVELESRLARIHERVLKTIDPEFVGFITSDGDDE